MIKCFLAHIFCLLSFDGKWVPSWTNSQEAKSVKKRNKCSMFMCNAQWYFELGDDLSTVHDSYSFSRATVLIFLLLVSQQQQRLELDMESFVKCVIFKNDIECCNCNCFYIFFVFRFKISSLFSCYLTICMYTIPLSQVNELFARFWPTIRLRITIYLWSRKWALDMYLCVYKCFA